MNTIEVKAFHESATSSGLFLTTAGYHTIFNTPNPLKEIVSNNRRDQNGRSYLQSYKKDDMQIAVQFVCTDSYEEGIGSFLDIFTDENRVFAETDISMLGSNIRLLCKSIGNVTKQGSYYLFTANFIKFA